MSAFPRTRAAAGYAAAHGRGDLTRRRATTLIRRLRACEALTAAGGPTSAFAHTQQRAVVLAARDLAGPAWLAARGDDPDIAAFTALEATPVPPAPADLDEIISRMLRARFTPAAP